MPPPLSFSSTAFATPAVFLLFQSVVQARSLRKSGETRLPSPQLNAFPLTLKEKLIQKLCAKSTIAGF